MMRPWTAMFAGLCLLAAVGCSRLTAENYEQINIGMAYPEVVGLIGEPGSCETRLGVKTCVWEASGKRVTVRFVADAVVTKSADGLDR